MNIITARLITKEVVRLSMQETITFREVEFLQSVLADDSNTVRAKVLAERMLDSYKENNRLENMRIELAAGSGMIDDVSIDYCFAIVSRETTNVSKATKILDIVTAKKALDKSLSACRDSFN